MPDTRDPSEYVRHLLEEKRKLKSRRHEIGAGLNLPGHLTADQARRQAVKEERVIQRQLEDLEEELRIAGWYESSPAVKNTAETAPPKPSQHKQRSTLSDREKFQRQAIQKNLKGPAYARFLHAHGIKPPEKWRERGCPGDYPQAYADAEWQHAVTTEKSRVAKRLKEEKQSLGRKSQ